MDAIDTKAALNNAIEDARERYKAANPLSDDAEENALRICRAATPVQFCTMNPSL